MDQLGQLRELPSVEASTSGNSYLRIQPEFRLAVTAFRMDVHRLPGRSLVREEVKAHVLMAKDNRHSGSSRSTWRRTRFVQVQIRLVDLVLSHGSSIREH